MRMKVTHEDFVVAWMTDRTIEDVAQTTGMTLASVKARSVMLRNKGVKLPLKRTPVLDDLHISQLNALVKKHSR